MFPLRQPKLSAGQKCRRKSNGEIVVTRFPHTEGSWTVAWLCHDKDGYPVLVQAADLVAVTMADLALPPLQPND